MNTEQDKKVIRGILETLGNEVGSQPEPSEPMVPSSFPELDKTIAHAMVRMTGLELAEMFLQIQGMHTELPSKTLEWALKRIGK